MDLRVIEYFLAVAEEGNISHAAELLHISQPALSKNIALLEADLDVKLFDRRGKRFSLSPMGARVLEHARSILDHGQQIRLLSQEGKEQKEAITVRMMCGSGLFSRILAEFRAVHPEIPVHLLQRRGEMDQKDADILVFSGLREHPYHTDRSVLREEILLLVPPEHPLSRRSEVFLRDMGEYSFMSLREGNDMRKLEDHFFELAGIHPGREIECDTPATLRALLQKGFGIGLVPRKTWDVVSGTGNKLLPIRDVDCYRYINVRLPHPEQAGDRVQILFDFLVQFFPTL